MLLVSLLPTTMHHCLVAGRVGLPNCDVVGCQRISAIAHVWLLSGAVQVRGGGRGREKGRGRQGREREGERGREREREREKERQTETEADREGKQKDRPMSNLFQVYSHSDFNITFPSQYDTSIKSVRLPCRCVYMFSALSSSMAVT